MEGGGGWGVVEKHPQHNWLAAGLESHVDDNACVLLTMRLCRPPVVGVRILCWHNFEHN